VARYDAIVIGAGPAGSTTAFRLARAGAHAAYDAVRAWSAGARVTDG